MPDTLKDLKANIPGGRVRTRFAPSPTGYMHVGGLRTALYAYLFAKKQGGDFILRIEDTDQGRLVEGAFEIITRTLKESGLHYDEGPDVGGPVGPYIQTERRDIYTRCADYLLEIGAAYRCFCGKEDKETVDTPAARGYDGRCARLTEAEIQARLSEGTPYVIRQKTPREGSTTFHDLVFGDITIPNEELDDGVLIKSDGLPTYNFANVVDDHLMGITHIIRGTEYLSSTPKYNLLYEAFGWEIPAYVHVSPVMKNATQKLSKRHGDPTYDDLLQIGYLREAVLNYVALVGWSPGGEREFFTLPELVDVFDIKGLSKSPAIFDRDKLDAFNAHYLHTMEPEVFYEQALPYLKQNISLPDANLPFLATLLQPRLVTWADISDLVAFVSACPDYDVTLFDHKKSKCDKADAPATLTEAIEALSSCPTWTQEAVHDALIALATRLEKKTGQIMWPVRVALSGQPSSPGGAVELCLVLGREESLKRLRAAIEKLAG